MKYAIVVFRARTQTINFYNILHSYGFFCALIETPKVIQANCGLSIKIDMAYINPAKEILNRRFFDSFNGVYIIWTENSEEKAQKIY